MQEPNEYSSLFEDTQKSISQMQGQYNETLAIRNELTLLNLDSDSVSYIMDKLYDMNGYTGMSRLSQTNKTYHALISNTSLGKENKRANDLARLNDIYNTFLNGSFFNKGCMDKGWGIAGALGATAGGISLPVQYIVRSLPIDCSCCVAISLTWNIAYLGLCGIAAGLCAVGLTGLPCAIPIFYMHIDFEKNKKEIEKIRNAIHFDHLKEDPEELDHSLVIDI